MHENSDSADEEAAWTFLLSQLSEGSCCAPDSEEHAEQQFDFACNEIAHILEERRDELRHIKWIPLGLATGFSMVLGVLAACGWINKEAAIAGVGMDVLIASYVLEKRESFKKIFVREKILHWQNDVREHLMKNLDNLDVRMRAAHAEVHYSDLET